MLMVSLKWLVEKKKNFWSCSFDYAAMLPKQFATPAVNMLFLANSMVLFDCTNHQQNVQSADDEATKFDDFSLQLCYCWKKVGHVHVSWFVSVRNMIHAVCIRCYLHVEG